MTSEELVEIKERVLRGIKMAQAAPTRSPERRRGSAIARIAISDLIEATLGREVDKEIGVSVRIPKKKRQNTPQ